MASTVAYCSLPDVKSLLPGSYAGKGADTTGDLPDTTDTTATSLTTLCIDASREVDAALAPYFCTFNAWNHATYPTPHYIRRIAKLIAASNGYHQLAIGDRNTAYGARARDHRESANALLENLLGTDPLGSSPKFYVIPNENEDTETLTFGAGGEFDLPEQEAFIQVQALLTSVDIPTILPESVKVLTSGLTLYALGRDFDIRFDALHQRWKFIDYKGDLRTSGDTKAITYDWTWKRHAEKQDKAATVGPTWLGGWQ